MKQFQEQNLTCWIGDDLAVDVYYEYTPGEQPILYPNDRADPGCDAEVVVNRVVVNNSDILDCLTQRIINKIEDDIHKYMTVNHYEDG